ncbi:MAG: response regulator [Ruthenibacterium sp.]
MLHTILVDDDPIEMKALSLQCAALPEVKVTGMFVSPFEALKYAQGSPVEFALLNIDMPEMNGFALCDKLREIRPDLLTVLMTAQPQSAAAAIRKRVDGILLKPYHKAELEHVLARVNLLRTRLRKRVYCHTFGRFDLFIDGQPVVFKSAKAKEILALCIYRQGAPVSIEEIVDKLWEDYSDIPGACSTFRTALKTLTDTLKQHNCGGLLIRGRGFCYIEKDAVDSDYYDFLNHDSNAICEFQNEFMSDYNWGIPILYALSEKKQQYEAAVTSAANPAAL